MPRRPPVPVPLNGHALPIFPASPFGLEANLEEVAQIRLTAKMTLLRSQEEEIERLTLKRLPRKKNWEENSRGNFGAGVCSLQAVFRRKPEELKAREHKKKETLREIEKDREKLVQLSKEKKILERLKEKKHKLSCIRQKKTSRRK